MIPPSPPGKFGISSTLLLALLILLPCTLFVGLRVALPGDGSSIGSELPPGRHGLPLDRLAGHPSVASGGFSLLAIDDRPVDELLLQLFTRPFFQEPGPDTSLRVYTTLSGEGQRDLIVSLHRRPIWPTLLNSWTFFTDLLLLLGVSLLVFVRRPRLVASRTYFILSCLIFSSGVIFFSGLQASDLENGVVFWLWFLGILLLYGVQVGAVVHFSLVFPTPRKLVERKPWLPLLGYLVVWLPYLAAVALLSGAYPSPNERLQIVVEASGVITLTGFPLALAIAIASYYRVFSERERRQTRWVLWGALVAIVPWLAVSVAPALIGSPIPDSPIIGILWWAIPITFAIAILRENLFSIDRLINRTIVYSLLTVFLAIIYFTSITLLQALFTAISGQGSPAAIAVSTLAIAALFSPLRRRIQTAIDRRFYRRKYDVEKALAAFSLKARTETDLDRLTAELLAVVGETMQPKNVSLWLLSTPIHKSRFIDGSPFKG